ncbi:hypothetical protein DCAR_0205667 [Daucus carota subsp. sativus]|uniref:Ubiquitin-like protease family profile domain-containing protein n=1 Tax=Daucus carota subsp. sativus TaxID=79200 RepID=A0AAF1ANB6_DAUCS|nr:hypothetical protein DCAR_0205667 [Daucus carota subsp. sativus]
MFFFSNFRMQKEMTRVMANELIDTKLLFDTEINLALAKDPTNEQLLDIKNIEFFPICAFDHYYLIVYHLRNWTYEIIDNIDRSKMDPKKCYSEKPKILHSHFVKYLHAKGHVGISGKVKKMKPTYLNMPWQTRNNSIDCGVFLMRHMESYKGDLKSWTTGLNVEKVKKSQLSLIL